MLLTFDNICIPAGRLDGQHIMFGFAADVLSALVPNIPELTLQDQHRPVSDNNFEFLLITKLTAWWKECAGGLTWEVLSIASFDSNSTVILPFNGEEAIFGSEVRNIFKSKQHYKAGKCLFYNIQNYVSKELFYKTVRIVLQTSKTVLQNSKTTLHIRKPILQNSKELFYIKAILQVYKAEENYVT